MTLRKLVPMFALTLLAPGAARAEVSSEAVLKAYQAGGINYPLFHPRISPEGRLILEVENTGPGVPFQPKQRAKWANDACENWIGAIRSTNAPEDPSLLILSPMGGSLWDCNEEKAKLVDEWDYTRTPFTGTEGQIGNFFMSVGGQASFNSVANSYGANYLAGVSLFKNVFDMGLSFSLVNVNTTMTLGLLLRYRIPINSVFGMNFGVQPLFTMSVLNLPADSTADPLTTSFSAGFLAGFNFNVPTGTVDVTGSYTTTSTYSMILGHTFYFNVR